MINKIKIPEELAYRSILPEDVNILVGENGSGKSFLLGELAEIYLHGNYSHVIAIANSIHDKFRSSGSRFHALKGSRGRRQTKDTLKKAFLNMAHDSAKRVRYASRALEYVHFDPSIGFKIVFFGKEDYTYKIDNLNITDSKKEQLNSLIRKYNNIDRQEIVWLEMNNYSFSELERYSLVDIFKWESLLVKLKIIKPIEVFLSKGKRTISLLEASSGELSLITSIIYISSVIDENTVILVDEPENSLHPKWQREYVKTMMDIFYLYQPRFVIATHSPLIIRGAELTIKKTKVFKTKKFEVTLQQKEPLNIEEIYYNYFNTTTPENRFLSELLINNLNKLSEKKMELDSFTHFISTLSKSIVDSRQNVMLESVSLLAKRIVMDSTKL